MQNQIRWLLQEKYKNKPSRKFKLDVERLIKGEPFDYVLGFKEFCGVKIDLTKKPLIPRPETEFWVSLVIEEISRVFGVRQKRDLKVLDIFCGSGCIGLAIVRHIKKCLPAGRQAQVTFADKENFCIEQTKRNLKLNSSLIRANKSRVIKSDIFERVVGKFDYIFANPPYVALEKKSKVQKEVLKYEPKTALFAGKDGLFIIKKFLKQAKSHLNPGGHIFMEFSPEQKRGIEKLLARQKRLAHFDGYKFHKDQFDRWRWVEIE